MEVGVNTHFEQGWPRANFGKVEVSRARGIREVVTWGKVEQQPGEYAFTEGNSGFIDEACSRSIPVLLVAGPRNKLYDGGLAAHSPTGQRAFARYVGALIDRFPCIFAVEVGNEINTASHKWPPRADKPAMYVSMLRAVRQEIDARARPVALVGGSSLGVAVDFHERLFAAGELPLIDAVAVHPYSKKPELMIRQFERLEQAMAEHGAVKPIWATEFGLWYPTPEDAPPHALKIISVMSAAGVERAFWYALLDEPWYPNMGLYAGMTPKPALATFQFAQTHLLPAGRARRIDSGGAKSFVYRYGEGRYVMWGDGERIQLPPGTQAFDAQGRRIAAPAALDFAPIVTDKLPIFLPGR
ncbi:MAG: hypothetical protein B7Z08_06255 [Sphingomonadales bacterium 32-68-7]|nr:MAG: hypothetical protein B7Z08_06255 [Sphingomonadales bacterium 32-68-7]